LEESHEYNWVDGEKEHNTESETINLDLIKQKIEGKTPRKLFAIFFSKKLKDYVLEAFKKKFRYWLRYFR